jgi:hypothetical protein
VRASRRRSQFRDVIAIVRHRIDDVDDEVCDGDCLPRSLDAFASMRSSDLRPAVSTASHPVRGVDDQSLDRASFRAAARHDRARRADKR